MEYTIEELSTVERKLTVTIPAEEVNASLTATIALYKTKTEIKGFRKGKAPSSIIESRFKSQIYTEATQDLVNYQLNEIFGEKKLVPLSRLNVDAEELVRDEDFIYTVAFEVAPDIDLPDYTGVAAQQEKPLVDVNEVDDVIERIRQKLASLEEVTEDRTAQDEDIAVISFSAWQEDTPIEEIKADNFELPLGQGQSLQGFEEIVRSLKAGEKGQGEVSFPDDFLNPEYAGKTVTMQVELHAIKRLVLPEINDQLATDAGGFDNVAAMREAIEDSYRETRKDLVKGQCQKKILDTLMDSVSFDLPPMLLDETINRLLAEQQKHLEQQGRSLESSGKTPEELREMVRDQAEETVRSQLFLLAIAAKESIEATPQQVENHLQQEAIRTGQDYQTIRRYYEDNNLLFALKDMLTADAAMEHVYSLAKITEIDPPAPSASSTENDSPAEKESAAEDK